MGFIWLWGTIIHDMPSPHRDHSYRIVAIGEQEYCRIQVQTCIIGFGAVQSKRISSVIVYGMRCESGNATDQPHEVMRNGG